MSVIADEGVFAGGPPPEFPLPMDSRLPRRSEPAPSQYPRHSSSARWCRGFALFHLPSRARLRSRILPENFLCVGTYDKPDDNWFEVIDTYGKRYYCIA